MILVSLHAQDGILWCVLIVSYHKQGEYRQILNSSEPEFCRNPLSVFWLYTLNNHLILGDNILRIELILLHILLWFLSYLYPPNAKATHRHPTRQWLLVCFTHKQLLKCGSPALSWTAESLQAFTKNRAITHRLLHRLVRCYLRFFLCFITVLHNFPNCLSFCLFSKYDIS